MKANLKKILSGLLLFCYFTFSYAQQTSQLRPQTISCSLNSGSTCIDSTPCKTVNGFDVCLAGVSAPSNKTIYTDQNCWEYQKDYTCLTRSSDCLSLQSTPGCTENIGSPQCAADPSGLPLTDPKYGCMDNIHTYTCVTQESTTKTVQSCTESFTQGGLNWSQSGGNATDQFISAVTGRQLQAQIGAQLAAGSLSLFAGDSDKCTVKVGGLKNCCQGSGAGGGSNGDIARQIGLTVAYGALKSGAAYAANVGSEYVYSALVSNGSQELATSFASSAGMQITSVGEGSATFAGGFGTGVGAMGFGTTASAAEGFAGTLGGSSVTGSTMVFTSEGGFGAASSLVGEGALAGQTPVLYFNPYALAAAVAIMVIMSYMSCDQSDAQTMASVSKNLCHYVGSYCSMKIPLIGTCIETKQSYCCFAGILDKEIQEGAHNQLGISWGSPQSPNCSGLTVDQITQIDFSRVDFSQFQAQVQSNMGGFDATAQSIMKDNATSRANSLSVPTR